MITEEHKNMIDDEIRRRISEEVERERRKPAEPFLATMYARGKLGVGINLENVCPYMRRCDFKAPEVCSDYRNCSHYKVNLVGDILSREVKLEEIDE